MVLWYGTGLERPREKMTWAKAQGDHMAGQEWGGGQEADPTREQSLIRAGVAGGADGTLLAVHLLRIPPPASGFRWRHPHLPPSMVLPRCSSGCQYLESTWLPTRDWGRGGFLGPRMELPVPMRRSDLPSGQLEP